MGFALDHAFAGMDLIDLMRGGYVTLAAGIIAVNSFEFLRERFISYGARSLPPKTSTSAKDEKRSADKNAAATSSGGGLLRLLNCVAAWDVPHSYFTQFYYCSVSVSLFWWYQLLTRGWAFQLIAGMVDHGSRQSSMSFNQIFLCWGLFTIQACRRLYECVSFVKPSKARMFAGLWLYGFAYYIIMGVAIWIEGT
ncbi:hypothetical protein FQN49_001345, partial [Arthroderma sp. PD_2]